jgi:hypothetical protein
LRREESEVIVRYAVHQSEHQAREAAEVCAVQEELKR